MTASSDPPMITLHLKSTRPVTTTRDRTQKRPRSKGPAIIKTSNDIMKTSRASSRPQREELRSLRDIRRNFLCFELGHAEIESGKDRLRFGAEGLESRSCNLEFVCCLNHMGDNQ